MISFVAEILGKLIEIIYELTGNNYGISIIIFTILTKLLLYYASQERRKLIVF